MRKPVIAGNWKMNKTPSEGRQLAADILAAIGEDFLCEVVVCPPFVTLSAVADALKGSKIAVGSQNMHWATEGAFTGEVSAAMLLELGAKYAVLGHSERRQYFGETDHSVNMRVKATLTEEIIPIICVGESLDERKNEATFEVVENQTRIALDGIDPNEVGGLIIAYEPVWAIGTGLTATDEQAEEVIAFIREVVRSVAGDAADEVRILYGGSMNAKNAEGLLSMPNIDGGLIGGASLKAADFATIVKAADRRG